LNATQLQTGLQEIERLISTGRIEEAERLSGVVLASAPGSSQARFMNALAIAHRHGPAKAEPHLVHLLATEPSNIPAAYLLADVHRATSRPDSALALVCKALHAEFALPGPADAPGVLRAMMAALATQPAARFAPRMGVFHVFGMLLCDTRVQPPLTGIDLQEYSQSPITRRADADFAVCGQAACALLGFRSDAPGTWTSKVFEQVMLPWLHRALAEGDIENALQLEHMIYMTYVKQVETEEHFEACFSRWKNEMREAGRKFAGALPQVHRGAPAKIPRVGFFLESLTQLAHARIMLDVLEGQQQLQPRPFEPIVYCIAVADATALERCRRAGITVVCLSDHSVRKGFVGAMTVLRQRLAQDCVERLVWISLAVLMPFAFAMRLAPVQIWWAMKYHRLDFPEIDGCVTSGGISGGFKSIAGKQWRAGPVAAEDWFIPGLAPQAAQVRSRYAAHRLLFGCFGREEKLVDTQFLQSVCEILRRNPDAGFLWTGRTQARQAQAAFEEGNVASRCHFIGWVNTRLYAQVIDVFLDSFPFPCGFTLYEAMAAGKPAVLFLSKESTNTGLNALVLPLLANADDQSEDAAKARELFSSGSGESLYLCAKEAQTYIAYATRLAQDAQFRDLAGRAARRFMDEFMADRKRAGRIYAEHFLAVSAAPAA